MLVAFTSVKSGRARSARHTSVSALPAAECSAVFPDWFREFTAVKSGLRYGVNLVGLVGLV